MRRCALVLALLCALASPLQAAIAFDAAAGAATSVTATSQTTSFTMGSGAGGCLIVAALGDATTDLLTTATFNGVSMTLVDKQNANPGTVYWQNLWALPSPPSGTHNIVVSASSSSHIQTAAASYTGVSASSCPAASAKSSGSGDPYVATITTPNANDWTVEVINSSVGVLASTNFTSRATDGGTTYYLADSNGALSAGSNSMNVTGAGGTKQHIIVALVPQLIALTCHQLDQVGINGGTGTAFSSTGASLIVVAVAWYNGTTATPTLTDSQSNTWTALTTEANFSDSLALYYVASPTTNASHTVTLSGSSIYASLAVSCFSGTAASPFDQQSVNGISPSATSIQPGSVTPTQGNELLLTAFEHNNAGDAGGTINGGFTIIETSSPAPGSAPSLATAYLLQNAAAAANPTWTKPGSAVPIATVIGTFKVAGGSSAPPTLGLLGVGR